ncbi:MAG: ComEC/Rec2 family competence protein [Candidatus Riflebacteria bacterium]|nr:ComEC/Rec2 family competence protein [Candidatus Riflebacteria bacterium]
MFYGAIRQNEKYNFSDLLILDNTQGILEGRYTGQSSIQHKNKIIYTFKEVSYTTNEQKVKLPIKVNCQALLDRQRLYPEQYYSLTGKMKIVSFDKAPVFEVASFTYSFSESDSRKISILTTAKELQENIRSGINKALNEEQSAIVNGFILGDTSKILNKSIFTETGISHILAISGQHIMILIFLMASIMHWFKIPPISRSVMISIILAF